MLTIRIGLPLNRVTPAYVFEERSDLAAIKDGFFWRYLLIREAVSLPLPVCPLTRGGKSSGTKADTFRSFSMARLEVSLTGDCGEPIVQGDSLRVAAALYVCREACIFDAAASSAGSDSVA